MRYITNNNGKKILGYENHNDAEHLIKNFSYKEATTEQLLAKGINLSDYEPKKAEKKAKETESIELTEK
jgi:hypothetical protein